jgi:Dyp-type peroxidase family
MAAFALKKEKLAQTGNARVQQGLPMAQLSVEAHDVQGLVFRGYGGLRQACYPLLQVGDAAGARRFVRSLLPLVSRGVPAANEVALHVAFTYAGLRALGLDEDALAQFSREFIAGMTDPLRSRFLGDVAESAPEHWQWGGPSTPVVHVMLALFTRDTASLQQRLGELRNAWTSAGLTEVRTLHAAELSETEHFGFADGISQPAIEGYHPSPSNLHQVKAGEFLLGYENEYEQYTERPLLPEPADPRGTLPLDVEGSPRRDLGRNGTYLVFRQLHQDVPAFRATLQRLTDTPQAAARLAAQMVGRWPSGTSLVHAPYADEPRRAKENEFRYHDEDRDGLKCPIGAHVRRANPRDALEPKPGTDRSLDINHRHRMLRRGRVYGEKLPEGVVDDQERGLLFIALNANITRQFEFVQHSWLIDPRFNGGTNEADPLISAGPGHDFVVPADPVRVRCSDLPRFVSVVGGAYFFLPGLRALSYLSEERP